MAKKSKKTKAVDAVNDVELDALVNEAKENIDMSEVDKVIEENEKDNNTVLEENVVEDVKPIEETVETPDVEDESVESVSEHVSEEHSEEEVTADEVDAEVDDMEESIDDVIAECIGSVDEAKEPTKDAEEPWYVARAKRMGDYYNW
nr:MAG TPA: hypothetical protein [Herelleviridae sp.]